ncbi:SDR family NAD(P)-dependent oxidoreductase [Nocardia nova]|uniref:SDR family NAD(P)-dependent oxidoreductase n=1 Tax=Nocardia nova TaxID=37330 RepID=UPI0033DDB630
MPKNVVITGANAGIGEAMTRIVAARGHRVTMACRNSDKAEAARAGILRDFPRADLVVGELDLASLESIRRFADRSDDGVDVLINNAGSFPRREQRTSDGFEYQFGANYLGHFLLSHLMLPAVVAAAERAGSARIVHMSSVVHYLGSINESTFRDPEKYRPMRAYAQSKLAMIMFNAALARRLPKSVYTVAMHPGGVATDIYRDLPWPVAHLTKAVLISPEEAALQGVALALDADPGVPSGGYSSIQRPRSSSRRARDIAQQERLYGSSCKLVQVDPLPTSVDAAFNGN